MSLREKIDYLLDPYFGVEDRNSTRNEIINLCMDAAIKKLNEVGEQVDITTSYGEGRCDALCIDAQEILQALKEESK